MNFALLKKWNDMVFPFFFTDKVTEKFINIVQMYLIMHRI